MSGSEADQWRGCRVVAMLMVGWILVATPQTSCAQNELMEWKSVDGLFRPPLSKSQRVMGETQRNTLFIEVRLAPSNTVHKVNLAVVYERLGEHAKALELYREVSKDESLYATAVSGFIKNIYLAGNQAGAVRFIRLAESRQPIEWDALLIKAELLVSGGKIPSALRTLENGWLKFQKRDSGPSSEFSQEAKAHLLNNLAYLYQQSGDLEKMEEVRLLMQRATDE